MLKSSIGYHTFTIFLRLTIEEAIELHRVFKSYSDVEVIPWDPNKVNSYANEFIRDLFSSLSKYYTIVYPGQKKGISWFLRISSRSPGFIHDDENKPCSIKATINPKIFTGIKDYVSASNQSYLTDVINDFNFEANKISSILGSFDLYSLNRSDYCINFDLGHLSMPCSEEQMMTLIKRGNIPNHFVEWTKYDETSHRKKPKANSFYLENGSIHINCYYKHFELKEDFSDCPNIDDALHVIRFEVQCLYLKVYNMSKSMKNNSGFSNSRLINELLSDEISEKEIEKYFYKIIRKGDYYTLEGAKLRITGLHNFNENKENRLLGALEFVNKCRGISKAKDALQGKDLEDFKRSLKDLDGIGINPVTIPKEWNIKHIPNLLDAYYNKIEDERNRKLLEQSRLDLLEDYFAKRKKRKKYK